MAERLTKEELDRRLAHIIAKREVGQTYEQIAKGLVKAGFKHNLTKVRVQTLIKQHRPDLMGSILHRKPWNQKK